VTDTVVPPSPGRPATTPAGPSRLGKLRRQQRISDADGFVRVAAIDHPENYLLLFDADLSRVGFEEVVESKLELIAGMAGHCTAVLADPVWSFGQAVLTGALPGQVGLISGLERLYWEQSGFATGTEVREHWTVATLARLGADAAKLVVFHREESDGAAQQHELVRRLAAECDEHELPLVVEPLWYALPGEDPADPAVVSARYAATVRSAAAFAASGADVLKVEFPGRVGDPASEEAAARGCAELDAGLDVPWVLLSASATFEQFEAQLRIAAGAGACGFMAGRAIWGDGVGRHDAETRAAGVTTACDRLDRLTAVLREHGRGWAAPPSVTDAARLLPADWHESYLAT
jgi:tagatose-1,6-bisphosphate aldolase